MNPAYIYNNEHSVSRTGSCVDADRRSLMTLIDSFEGQIRIHVINKHEKHEWLFQIINMPSLN